MFLFFLNVDVNLVFLIVMYLKIFVKMTLHAHQNGFVFPQNRNKKPEVNDGYYKFDKRGGQKPKE